MDNNDPLMISLHFHVCKESQLELTELMRSSLRSRLPWRCVPKEAVPRPDGKLQSPGKTRPKRLCTHCCGTWPHTATNHRRGECVCTAKV